MASHEFGHKRATRKYYGPYDTRDLLSQIGECLQGMGYKKALKALEKEAAEDKVDMNVALWTEVNKKNPYATLLGMWSFLDQDTIPLPSLEPRIAGSNVHKTEENNDKNVEAEAAPETMRHAKSRDKISDDASGSSSGTDMMERAAPPDQREEKSQTSDSESSSSDSEVDGKEDDGSDSDSSSDSGSESEVSVQAGQKRKREVTPKSSDNDSLDLESESDDDVENDAKMSSGSESVSDSSSSVFSDSRPLKRTKLAKDDKKSVSDNSSSDSDSDSSSSSGGSSSKKRSAKRSSGSSSSDSSSDSSSSRSMKSASNSDSSDDSSSDSSSESSSDSDSGSLKSPSPKKKVKKENKSKTSATVQLPKIERTGSATSSSATLEPTSPANSKVEKATDTLVVPDAIEGTKELPATKENIKKLKKEQVPFSRIPANTKVDPRFSSNAYIPYDYADRAYQDLSVTRGKGFTKEKNKKKRGKSNQQKSAEQRDWEKQSREDLSMESSQLPSDFYGEDDNPFGFKEDAWAFMSGCGVIPMSGSFGG